MNNLNIVARIGRKYNHLRNIEYKRKKTIFIDKQRENRKLIIFGNQKSGTTVVAALIGLRSAKSTMLDIKDAIPDVSWQLVYKYKLADFSEFIFKHEKEFKKEILKEPSLTFFKEELSRHFPYSNYLFVLRNPIDNIRSILNRLKIPGNLFDIEYSDWDELNKYPIWRLTLDSTWLGQPRGNYIEALSYRWCVAANVYLESQESMYLLKYEDFLKNKKSIIDEVCVHFELPGIVDVADSVDQQFQSKSSSKLADIDFFGKDNLERIKNICSGTASNFGYNL